MFSKKEMSMKKQFLSLLSGITLISLTCGAMNIETGRELPITPMEQDGTVTNPKGLPDRMNMALFLVAKNKKGETVVHEYNARMHQSDIQNMLNYKADQSIIKSLSLNKDAAKIISDNIFKLAAQDSIAKDFNHTMWEFNQKEDTYTIILPAPYVDSLKWHPVANIKDTTFQTLWKTADLGINYYLSGLQKNIWPYRSWSGALARFGSDPGFVIYKQM
jgi:hypothetical protein